MYEPDEQTPAAAPPEREGAPEPLRTPWANGSALMRHYYDTEWGLPVTDEQGLYERLCLEGFQAGLSWATVLSRREAFRRAFRDFDPEAAAAFGEEEVRRLVGDAAIIRSRPKILAAVGNARAVLELRERAEATHAERPGSGLDATGTVPLTGFELTRHRGKPLSIEPGLPALIWSFCPPSTPIPEGPEQVPTQSPVSAALARTLKRNGFRFVGPTSVYAMMEAIGMVDTHATGSHRRGASGIFGPDGLRPER
ncbi:DNA-3-methyladenine glycosylase I [Rothia kristinae]|uniref:DNA-3-methyladenine glycosylase I n=1 Tax=Rothia kristinae TaxID=37923 RepID=UPI0022E6F061|nr:DNA-3-methyladenine glycosylase I [Rothia kristinae]